MCIFCLVFNGGGNILKSTVLVLLQSGPFMSRLIKYLLIPFAVLFFFSLSLQNSSAEGQVCETPFSGITPDEKYDFSMALFRGGFEQFSSDWPRIFASGIPVKKNADGTEEIFSLVQRSGRVVLAPPRYIITNNHIIDVSFFMIPQPTPFGVQMKEVKTDEVRDGKYWLKVAPDSPEIPLVMVKVFPDVDAAFFQISDESLFPTSRLPLGRSGDLCLGHTIFILGSPGVLGMHVREGVVSAFHFIPQELLEKKIFGPLEFNLLITVSLSIDRGDSGSPFVAFRDGAPEIIGIASNVLGVGGLMHGLNMIVPIDEIVKRVHETTGIDLKKLSDDYFHT